MRGSQYPSKRNNDGAGESNESSRSNSAQRLFRMQGLEEEEKHTDEINLDRSYSDGAEVDGEEERTDDRIRD